MTENEYKARINQAINYIYKNVDKNLTVDDIADHCCFSKFYFNRIFKSVVNESLYSFIKRMKLEYAAILLKTGNSPVTDIALQIGYSPLNFASAFKTQYGFSASEYRSSSGITVKDSFTSVVEHIKALKMKDDFFKRINSKIKIKKLGPVLLEYERFIGNYLDLSPAWNNFCINCMKRDLVNDSTRFIGISYDDPLIADESNCIYDMCIAVDKPRSTNTHKVEAGYYACYEFHDRLENLSKAYNEIFSLWMPFSGYDIDNRIPLEIYLSSLEGDGRMRIDLYISIKSFS